MLPISYDLEIEADRAPFGSQLMKSLLPATFCPFIIFSLFSGVENYYGEIIIKLHLFAVQE